MATSGVDGVRARVAAAAARAGRAADGVTLVAVVKYASVETVRRLVAAGVADLGENHAQQLRDRAAAFAEEGIGPLRWHAIGPLQTNKAKYVARWAHAFHALDRIEVAEALGARRRAEGLPPLACYVQVNVAAEPSKAGVAPEGAGPLVARCRQIDGIDVVGLMAMPPPAPEPEASRPWFRLLAALAEDCGVTGLSMGTSGDFEVAVEEGATAVRVGGALTA